jgi:hypothetical protein
VGNGGLAPAFLWVTSYDSEPLTPPTGIPPGSVGQREKTGYDAVVCSLKNLYGRTKYDACDVRVAVRAACPAYVGRDDQFHTASLDEHIILHPTTHVTEAGPTACPQRPLSPFAFVLLESVSWPQPSGHPTKKKHMSTKLAKGIGIGWYKRYSPDLENQPH